MRGKLSTRFVKALEAKETKYKAWDTELKGLCVRILPSGTKTFLIQYRSLDGKTRDYTLGRFGVLTVDEARRLAKTKLGEIAFGKDIQSEKQIARKQATAAQHRTLLGFTQNKYQPWVKTHLKSHKEQLRTIYREFAHLHNRPMANITRWDLDKWVQQAKQKGKKPATINRQAAVLKAVLSKALEWQLIEYNPLKGSKQLKIDNKGRVRYLSDEEKERLYHALEQRQNNKRAERLRYINWCKQRKQMPPQLLSKPFIDYLAPMVKLAVNTGLRRGELFDLDWSAVQLNSCQLTVVGEKAKSGKTRHIPLSNEAVKVLTIWWNQSGQPTTGLIFPSPITGQRLDNIKKSWSAVVTAAQLDNFNFHDLRHTFASQLVMRGVDLNTVRELLGHSSLDMTLRYAHLAPEHKANAIAVLNK